MLWRTIAAVTAWLVAGVPAAAGEMLASVDLAGDATRGETVYERCEGCHSLDANRVGPAHRGVYGREAGAVEDFRYSKALRAAGVVWTEETLNAWLTDPRKFIPGSRMGFRLSSPQERADVIAFLKRESGATH